MTQLGLFDQSSREEHKIHYARLENSPRLQRLLALLKRGGWWGTRTITREAEVYAVNTAMDELRCNGIGVDTRCVGRGRYEYRLNQGGN